MYVCCAAAHQTKHPEGSLLELLLKVRICKRLELRSGLLCGGTWGEVHPYNFRVTQTLVDRLPIEVG